MVSPSDNPALIIEEWSPQHPGWKALQAFIREQGQSGWVDFSAEWHQSSHILVALHKGELAGFLRFVVQVIGPDADCPPVRCAGRDLLEAKVLAFAVHEGQRRVGIGRGLQLALIKKSKALGCYQIRSHSSGDNTANHQLKLSLGFGVHPIIRGDDNRGVYFILPLGPF